MLVTGRARAALIALAVVAGLGHGSPARAGVGDVLAFPFRWVGGQVVAGGVDKLKGALEGTISDVDLRLTRHEYRVAGLAGALLADAQGRIDATLEKVDHSLEARILQVRAAGLELVDRFDLSLEARLRQVERIGTKLVAQAGGAVQEALDRADQILRERSADIDRMADELLVNADRAVEARIAQLDEVVGRRLGSVDVIASKQRLAFERGAIRVAVLIGAVVFIVFVMRRLWTAYSALARGDALPAARGAERTVLVTRSLALALLGPLAAAALGGALLAGLYRVMPLDAEKEAQALVATHRCGLDAAVAGFDVAGARFHATQLEILDPAAGSRHAALVDKAALLRDLAERPALLATREQVAAFVDRVDAVERRLGPSVDPDLLVLRAVALWEGGETRAAEHQAATLAARALRARPRGFALAPLAHAYIETFLQAPFLDPARGSASLAELSRAAAAPVVAAGDSPLAAAIELAGLMRRLDAASSTAYVNMIRAHAAVAAAARVKKSPAREVYLAALLARRNAHARQVYDAWLAFDAALQRAKVQNDARVLAIFHLNDAVLVRALWFLERPAALAAAPRLEDLPKAAVALRVKLAPPRIAWARRYAAFFRGPAKEVVEFEEAERYRAWERWTIELEQAMVAEASGDAGARRRAALAAAALSIYVDADGQRVALAAWLAGDLLLPGGRPEAAAARPTLEEAVRMRGPRII